MNGNLSLRGETSKERRATRATQVVAWCVTASLTGALLLALPDGPLPPVAPAGGEAVAARPVADAPRAAPAVVVSDELADRHRVEASIAAYGN
jgi:hypothetical protein